MPRSQDKLALSIIQKEYNQKSLPALEEEIECLKKFLAEYKTKSSGSIYEKLKEPRRQLVTPLTMTNEQYAASWLKVEYRRKKLQLYAENGFFPGKNLIITMETSKKQLSSKMLKEIIKTYLK